MLELSDVTTAKAIWRGQLHPVARVLGYQVLPFQRTRRELNPGPAAQDAGSLPLSRTSPVSQYTRFDAVGVKFTSYW